MVLELVTKKLVKPVGGGLHEVAGTILLAFINVLSVMQIIIT